MSTSLYSTLAWRIARARVLARDDHACRLAPFLGGDCSPGPVHVHHLTPVAEGGDPYDPRGLVTACARHHRALEAFRKRWLADEPEPPRCRHYHRTAEARRICEARLARQSSVAA